MKKYLLIATCLTVTACAGSAFDPAHRAQATFNVFEGSCPSGEYVLLVDNPNNKQGWKTQREFGCKGGALAQQHTPLNGQTYKKQDMIDAAKADPLIHNLFAP